MKSLFSLKAIITLLFLSIFSINQIFSQVGIGTTTPRGALDVSSTTQGIVPPQVALTNLNLQAPVINPQGGVLPNGTMVWNTNTAGTLPNNVSPGLYYWLGTRWISVAGSPGGLDWSIIGNGGIDGGTTGATGVTATQGANFIGTYDVTNMDIRTAGLHAARVSSLGEFFIGALETVLPGDLMNGVSEGNTVFPWAINGYTDQNGGGVYGSVSGGNTDFAAVQGEYSGTSDFGSAVRGVHFGAIGNNGSTLFNPIASVDGVLGSNLDGSGVPIPYSSFLQFGVRGSTTVNSGVAVGGVIGVNESNNAYGILGYRRSNNATVAVVGNTNYSNAGFRTSGNQINNAVGFALQGGFLGGHVKGDQYGLITKGSLAGLYTDGTTITNKGYAVINKDQNGNKTPMYVPTSTTVDVSTKGTGKLINGEAFISFENNYSNLLAKDKPIIVTVSPMGESNGVYIAEVSKRGFKIKENNSGSSNVTFYWIAIGEKYDTEKLKVPSEFLEKDFDKNLDSYLTIDEENVKNPSKAMWWNGSKLKFGAKAPESTHQKTRKKIVTAQRYDERKRTPRKANLRASQLKKLQKKE